jgi:hypothetical protein
VHHALHLNERGHPLRYDAYAPTAQSFTVGGFAAQTLGREEMLWHIYRHVFCMPLTYEPLRLIWVADLISLVEAWVDVLDWERVRRQYRAAWNVLPLLHSLSPWSEAVLERLRLPIERLPAGAGAAYEGWPRFTRRGGCGCVMGRGHNAPATGGPGWRTSAGCRSRSGMSSRGKMLNPARLGLVPDCVWYKLKTRRV